jgi:hypothetical protein
LHNSTIALPLPGRNTGSRALTGATIERAAADTGRASPIRPDNFRNCSRRTAQMATNAAEYKASRRLFGPRRRFRKKAIANRVKRAHGESMHNTSAVAGLSDAQLIDTRAS